MTAYQRELASDYNNLATLYRVTDKPAEAEEAHRQALAIRTGLVRLEPHSPEYRHELATSHFNLAGVYHGAERPHEAEKEYRRAADLEAELVGEFPAVPEYAVQLGKCEYNLGLLGLVADNRDPRSALGWYHQAVLRLEATHRQHALHPVAQQSLVFALRSRALLLADLDRPAEALHDWDRVFQLEGEHLAGLWRLKRAESLALLGAHAAAAAEVRAVTAQGPPSGNDYCMMACVYAVATAAASRDLSLASDERERLTDAYARRGVDMLVQADKAGWFKDPSRRAMVRSEPFLEVLRRHVDFRKHFPDLDEKTPPKARYYPGTEDRPVGRLA